ncbi:hypothetical protein [Klebsiella phage pKP-BM327-1.1]|nr:hypothetical protein [Klebsiella phage pKP-BM327-1.1]
MVRIECQLTTLCIALYSPYTSSSIYLIPNHTYIL